MNLINNITLIMGYSTYIVIGFMAFVLVCGKVDSIINRKKKQKALKGRREHFMKILKSA